MSLFSVIQAWMKAALGIAPKAVKKFRRKSTIEIGGQATSYKKFRELTKAEKTDLDYSSTTRVFIKKGAPLERSNVVSYRKYREAKLGVKLETHGVFRRHVERRRSSLTRGKKVFPFGRSKRGLIDYGPYTYQEALRRTALLKKKYKDHDRLVQILWQVDQANRYRPGVARRATRGVPEEAGEDIGWRSEKRVHLAELEYFLKEKEDKGHVIAYRLVTSDDPDWDGKFRGHVYR